MVGTDAVEAVRNNQKVADFRPGANLTAIAATGSLVAIGFAVRGTVPKSAHAGVFAHPPPSPIFFFFLGSESSAVRLGWQGAPGGWPFGCQQGSRERPRVLPRWSEARCWRRESNYQFFFCSPRLPYTLFTPASGARVYVG